MKNYLLVIIIVCSLHSCRDDSTIRDFQESANNCLNDSTLLSLISSQDLLFEKGYILSDSIGEFLNVMIDSSNYNQNYILSKLIEADSIPNLAYLNCKNRLTKNWIHYDSLDIIENQSLEEMFKDPYIINGKVDNYKTLKQSTGKDGIIYVSDFYFSPDFNFVLVEVVFHCGWSCGQTQTRLYNKKNSKWELNMKYIRMEN